jgi:hypothetical protein
MEKPRGLSLLAWVNVVVGAGAGWAALFGVATMVRAGGGVVRVLPPFIIALVQVSAGLGLLEGGWWARRVLVYCAGWRLTLMAASLATAGVASWMEALRSGAVTPMTLLLFDGPRAFAAAVSLVTVVYLLRPRVRSCFPTPSPARWIALDASVVLCVVGLGLLMRLPAPPRVAAAPPRVASSAPIEPGIGPATLVPTYRGTPLRDFTDADVRLTLMPVAFMGSVTGGVAMSGNRPTPAVGGPPSAGIGQPLTRWRVRHGRIRVAGVAAGLYVVTLTIAGHNANGGGDLTAIMRRIDLRTGHGPVRVDVPLGPSGTSAG